MCLPARAIRVFDTLINPQKTLKSFIKLGDALTLSLAKRVAIYAETDSLN